MSKPHAGKTRRKTRRKKQRVLHSDFGPPERRRHDPVVIEHVGEESQAVRDRARVYSRSPLKTYFRRKLIDGRQPLAIDRRIADRGRRSCRLLHQGEGPVSPGG